VIFLVRGESAGPHAQLIAIHDVVERGAQAAVVLVFERDESKGLQYAIGHLPHRRQNLRHAVHWTSLRLKSNFDEVAASQRMRQPKQTASYGNGLEFSFSASAVFKSDRSQDRIAKLDPGRAPRRVRLGEVGHNSMTMALAGI